jgi:hypothetical protein
MYEIAQNYRVLLTVVQRLFEYSLKILHNRYI